MTQEKVASTTHVSTRMSLYHWLDHLPFHTTLVRRSELWAQALEKNASVAVWAKDEEGEFFFY